ncbi:MAG: hypothetical protein ABSD74_20730 [Rhizomicrobium sp.]|jgi:hypothetical protein
MTDQPVTDPSEQLPTKRQCGECDLCCTAVGVYEIGKPPGVACGKLAGVRGSSCSIYADRPSGCRQFFCLWRGSDSLLPERLWPARSGFVLSLTGIFGKQSTLITVHPNPSFPRSWRAPYHMDIFKMLAREFNAIVVIGEAHLAELIISPRGNLFRRDEHPDFFKDNGRMVGIPDSEFLPHRLSPDEIRLKLGWR